TAAGNTATLDGGGGISLAGGVLVLENSTVAGNTGRAGGGIQFDGRAAAIGLTVRNSTVSGNTATSGSGGGIALYNFAGTLLVQNSTITNNFSGNAAADDGAGGGGIAVASLAAGAAGAVTLQSTIVAGNAA